VLLLLLVLLQSDQSSAGLETRCPDSAVVAASHRQHRAHLLHVLHHLRHPRRSGLSFPRGLHLDTVLYPSTTCLKTRSCNSEQLKFVIERVSRESKAGGSVRLSVRPFVSLVTPSFEPIDLRTSVSVCVWVMTLAPIGLKLEVIGQGQ